MLASLTLAPVDLVMQHTHLQLLLCVGWTITACKQLWPIAVAGPSDMKMLKLFVVVATISAYLHCRYSSSMHTEVDAWLVDPDQERL